MEKQTTNIKIRTRLHPYFKYEEKEGYKCKILNVNCVIYKEFNKWWVVEPKTNLLINTDGYQTRKRAIEESKRTVKINMKLTGFKLFKEYVDNAIKNDF